MTDELTLKILAEIAAPGSGHLFSRREAARSAIALIEQQAARIAEFERILDGLPQDAIDGGWTARGISAYAKQLESRLAAPVADSAMAKDADLSKMIADLEAEQTFISSCRERCSPVYELPRWDRIQAVIDHLKSQQRG